MAGPSVAGSMPSTRRVPDVAGDTAPIIRIVEDLPAPLGPRNPNASPRRTRTSMPSTAVKSPKCLVRSCASTSYSDMAPDGSARRGDSGQAAGVSRKTRSSRPAARSV